MKWLINWGRRQRQQGKLKHTVRLYIWWRSTRGNVRSWWQQSAVRAVYPWGLALRSEWEDGHLALGRAYHRVYSRLTTEESLDEEELVTVAEKALSHYRKVLELNPERLETYVDFFSLLYLLGQTDEASAVLQQYEDTKRRLADECQADRLGIRFIPTNLSGSVGLLGNLDYYIKAGLLGWRPSNKIVMLLPEDIPASNPRFLDYWSEYITVVSDSQTIEQLSPMTKYLEDPINWSLTLNGKAHFVSAANTMVQKQWDAENRPPLLTSLIPEDYERGWQCLEGLGVSRGSWFVCLHVREPGFKDRGFRTDSFRNANIDTYIPAIETIVAKGGWVIRLGNPTMKPFPEMEQVIDYAHSDVRSDWMDVFLCSQCSFLIGTASGPNPISIAFGVPMVLTNYLPWNLLHFSQSDLFLPRLLWSLKEERHLTFKEILSSKVGAGIDQVTYDRLGVKILENTPEEINDIVVEMLMRQEGTLAYSESDELLQEQFRTLTAECNTFVGQPNLTINPRIGRDFLRKYDQLLDGEVPSKLEQLAG